MLGQMSRQLLTIPLVWLSVFGLAVANDVELSARFRKEAPEAWTHYLALARNIDIEATETTFNADGTERIVIFFQDKLSGSNGLRLQRNLKGPVSRARVNAVRETVICRNARYGFQLSKQQLDHPWLVTYVGDDVAGISKKLQGSAEVVARTPLSVFHKFLPTWIEEGFTVKSVDWAQRQSGQRVALAFETEKPSGQRPSNWVRSGVIWLNPERLWAVEGSEVSVATPKGEEQRWSQSVEFLQDPPNLPLVRRRQSSLTGATGKFEIVTDFARFELREVPEYDFTLAAFGLPEASQPSAWARARLWLILTLGGAICIIVAIALRRRNAAQ
jgi:hypothetical protein